MYQHRITILSALVFTLLFIALADYRNTHIDLTRATKNTAGQVVISAPVQIFLYAGDRFLAADIEAMRAATLDPDGLQELASYRIRSHLTVSRLNPCHEDNYYMGNAVLTWGGLEEQGSALLKRATECRFWDEMPPFFYGFNQYFFHHDIKLAKKYFEIAAQRSTKNAAAFRKLSVMITVEQFDDDKLALGYLRSQTAQARDPKLKNLLSKRLKRLEGLVELRNARKEYEARFGKKLTDPNELIETGILKQFPNDPLKLGYLFENGKFSLRTLKVQGLEREQ